MRADEQESAIRGLMLLGRSREEAEREFRDNIEDQQRKLEYELWNTEKGTP